MFAVSAASESLTTEEKPAFFVSNAPAAPPESVEARVALRQHREARPLNRYTFPGNVLKGVGDLVDHWVVIFCPGWHDKCQGLLPSYELLGVQWENKLNKAVMSSYVRFANVDCATDKALCVSLDIDDYPSVVHYHNHQRVASWHGGAPGLVRFVKQELEGQKRRPTKAAPQPRKAPVCGGDVTLPDAPVEDVHRGWTTSDALRSVCLVLMLMALSRCAMLAFTARNDRASHAASKPLTASREVTQTSVHASSPENWVRERPSIVL